MFIGKISNVNSYEFLRKVTNYALLLLALSITLAVVDNIYFEEAYRDSISTVGIIALGVFFISIVGAVIKGALDKRKKDV